MTPTIRPATVSDVEAVSALINHFAAQNLMLPRSESQVGIALPDFLVAEEEGRLAGCGSLIALTPSLAEIRSLAVAPDYQGNGLGAGIVASLLEMARMREIGRVCALTLRPNFFRNQGFQVTERWSLTPKIWSECVFCPKFHRCDEVAVLINLGDPEGAPDGAAPWWRTLVRHTPLPVLRRLAPHLV